jgi:hypothetical protein
VVSALLLLASVEFVIRGPLRFAKATEFNDFISPYTQAEAWRKGVDPYSPATVVALWPTERRQSLRNDLAAGTLVLMRGIPTAYPPTSLVVLAPISLLPWQVAQPLWLAISTLMYGATVLSLIFVAGFAWLESRTLVFLGFALGFAPVHTGMAAGSIVIVAVGSCALALWTGNRHLDIVTGVLLAIAVGLKPQIGLPFLAYFLLRRQWRVFGAAAALLAMLSAIAVLRLAVSHAPWIDSYRYDNRVLFAHGSLGDFTDANPIRFGLINLQVLLYLFVPDRTAANLLAFIVAGILGLIWLFRARRRYERAAGLLDLSALLVLSLLPIYHRLYDASLLIFPVAWAFSALTGSHRTWARWTLFLLLVFLVPGGTALEQLQRTSFFPELQQSWGWTHFVMPHQIWTLIALSIVLLLAMREGGAVTGQGNSG